VEALLQKRVLPRLERHPIKTPGERLFYELLARVQTWMTTLGRLANVSDFQAVIACDRALFEITVDLTLMRFGSTAYPPEKMLAWDESAKLKACQTIEDHFAKRGIPVPAQFQPEMQFLQKNAGPITALRAKYFLNAKGKPVHPPRWTGRRLGNDAEAAQALATPKELEWPWDLETFYATRYPAICWNVHGSGAAGIRFVQEENLPMLGTRAMLECMNFAVRCAQLVLVEFGVFGANEQRAFRECQGKRNLILKQMLTPDVPVTVR
jgi:hypothetical protein